MVDREQREQKAASENLGSVRDDYRDVLFSWNDNLNRLLALVQTYFGAGTRQTLEEKVFEEFTSIGRALDYGLQRLSTSSDDPDPIPRVGHRLNELSQRVYEINVRMLQLLDRDLLGVHAPSVPLELHTDDSRLEFGAQGPDVRDLQHRLTSAGHDVTVDGDFGRETYSALLSLQRQLGLMPDGVYGPHTRMALSE